MENVKCKTPPLPDGTTLLQHQVAGHFFGEGRTKYGFLQHSNGSILKPCQTPPRGLRELEFYQCVFDPQQRDEQLVHLREFLPQFLGTWSTPEHPNVQYICMEDVTKRISHPCIADAKIGPITYDPDASPEKKQYELLKFKDLVKVRFRLSGMRVYKWNTSAYEKIDKDDLKLFTAEEIFNKGFVTFLNQSPECLNRHITVSFLRRLLLVKKWFLSQRKFRFIATSLLMVYSGDFVQQNYSCDACGLLFDQNNLKHDLDHLISSEDTVRSDSLYSTGNSMYTTEKTAGVLQQISSSTCENCDKYTLVKMIDFAHVCPDDQFDENYMVGLNSLISHFVHALNIPGL